MEWGGSVITTSDGHWIFSAWAASSDGDVPGNAGAFDTWVFKTDTLGNIIWSKTFGGMGQEEGGWLAENPDGSFWLVGETHSKDGIFAANKGGNDIYVLKLSASGDLLLNKTFGGAGADDIQNFVPTADGGLLFSASSWSSSGSGDVIFNHGERDCWLVKLDENAEMEWQKSIGGSKHESQCQVHTSKNGGFWLTLESRSSDGDFPVLDGTRDTWLLRLDDFGNILWKKRLGLPGEMSGHQSGEDADGNMVVMQQFYWGYPSQFEKFAPDGSLISSVNIDFVFPEGSFFKSFGTTDDGSFYFLGVDSMNVGFLKRTTANLQTVWEASFPGAAIKIPGQIMPLAGNSLLVVGVVMPEPIWTFDPEQDVQVWVAKLGGTSATAEVLEKMDFQIFPNPVSANQPLQISLENDFIGQVKFEILRLDGRVLHTFFREKAAREIFKIFEISAVGQGAFLVRVSAGKSTVTRLVFRL